MSQTGFRSKSIVISGLLVAVVLITARTWVHGQGPSPTHAVPIQNQPDGASPHLEATFAGNILLGTVTVSDKGGRPWTGMQGEAHLSDSSGRQIAGVSLELLSPGEFRLIAPLDQLDGPGYLEIRVPTLGQVDEHQAIYKIDRDRRSIVWTGAAYRPGADSESHPSASLAPQATGGPDEFGYTWDSTTTGSTYIWIDTSGGTEIALRDDDFIGPYDIGFTFAFYGLPYTQFYVDSNGYIGFDNTQTESSPINSPLPYARRPNNVIAPFWDDFDPSQGGTVRYQTFGTAPNRYLVVEWNAVPLWYSPSDAQSFQLILHETTNDIKFQFPATRQGDPGDRRYGTVGIENQDGTIGLEYNYLIETYLTRTVHYEYNQPAYNVFLVPERQGSLVAPGEANSLRLTVKNLGASSDSFVLASSGCPWPVSFYAADGSTPLPGNNTGTILSGDEKEAVVKIQVPGTTAAGAWSRVTVLATSQGNPGESHQVELDAMVGTSFAQVYTDNESGDGSEDSENYIDFLVDGKRYTYRLTTDQDNSAYAGVAGTPGGNAVAVWNTSYDNGTAWVNEIQYAVLSRQGSFVQPVTRLTDNSAATQKTTDFSPAVDVASNGSFAIGWAQQVDTTGDGSHDRFNAWYAIVGSDGAVASSPTALTSNTSEYPRDYPPSVAALTDTNRFLLAWEHAELSGEDVTVDVYYAVLNNDGTILKPATHLTDGPGWNVTPRVTAIADGGAAIVWTAFNPSGYREIFYATVDNDGMVTGAPTQITSNGDSSAESIYADAVALSDGRLAVAWTQASDAEQQIQYTIIGAGSTPQGLYGQVNYQGAPVGGINLALRFYDGAAWSTVLTTTTQADGTYSFMGAPVLGAGQRYYVLYDNGDYGNTLNTNYLALWRSFDITSYTAGASAPGGDFDIADIPLASPAGGSTVPLPQTFEWTVRSATASDSYEFHLYDPADLDPWWWTDPFLGYVGSYQLTSLPAGFSNGVQYGWTVFVHAPDGGYGAALYLRTITFSGAGPQGIHGQVNYQGAPIAGINLALRFHDGAAWSTVLTTTTQADGTYLFTGAPALGAGQRYYVLYDNGDYGNTLNTNYLALWRSFDITSYTAGTSTPGGDFDIANIPLVSPAGGSTVPLPQTFEWTVRAATTSDSYQLHLYDPADLDPWWWTDPPLGYVGSYELTSLPAGFSNDVQYGWTVWAHAPDGGYGAALYYRTITFSDAGPQGIHGQVNYQGAPVAGINLALRFYDGAAWSTALTTTTQADGTYLFTGAPTLGSGQQYYVLYGNNDFGNPLNLDHLAYWSSFPITSYTAGSDVAGGDFDIADVVLASPAHGSTVTLPQTFQWTLRSATTSDSYEFNLYDPADRNPWWWTDPPLGYVGSYELTSLPSGFSNGVQYGWTMWVHAPDGGHGAALYLRYITFSATSSTAPGPGREGLRAEMESHHLLPPGNRYNVAEEAETEIKPSRQLLPDAGSNPGDDPQVETELLLQLWPDDGNRPTHEPLAEMDLLPQPLLDDRDTLPSDDLDRSLPMHQPYHSAQVAYTEFDDVSLARISAHIVGAAQTIHIVPNDLSTANIYVSLTTDEDDHLIMTWLDGYRSQYLFYALADSDGNMLTPATIFQRTRHSYLWSSWNGYGNDTLSVPHVPTGPSTVYLPLVFKNYPPPPPQQPVENGEFEPGDFSYWTVGGDEAGLNPRVVTSQHYGGTYAALLGQENAPCRTAQGGLVGQSWIYQDITVPSSGSPKLLLYYRILSYDKLNADDYDRFEIYIDGALLGRFGNTNPGNHGSGRCGEPIDDTGWQQFTYDLTAYRGQTIRLRLVNITHPDDWYGTWTYVDDVQLTDYY